MEVMHKVITVREEKVVNVDGAHGAVTLREMDFSDFSELVFLAICFFSNSMNRNCLK